MKLIYLWSSEFYKASATGRSRNNFQFEEGFLLSSDYTVTFSYEKGELCIRRKNERYENFFGKNVSEVVAIVGENGAGKTTVLSMLAEQSSTIRYEYSLMGNEYLTIFEESGHSVSIYYYMKRKLKFNFDKSLEVHTINLQNDNMAGTEIEHNSTGIFISNNFEWRDFYNLSLLEQDPSKKLIEYNFAQTLQNLSSHPVAVYGAKVEDRGNLDKIQSYGQKMERNILKGAARYQMKVLVSSMRSIPSSLKQELSGIYGSFYVGTRWFSHGFNRSDGYQEKEIRIYEEIIGYKQTKYFLFSCYQLIMFEACYYFGKSVEKMIRQHFTNEKEEIVDVEFLYQVINQLKTDITSERYDFDIENLEWYQQLVESTEIFEKYKDERFHMGAYAFSSAKGKRFLEFLSDVFKQENSFFERVLEFKTYPASTGESVLAYFFAYIHDAVSYQTKDRDIVIFIDEIDAALHPRWQQSVLKYLLDYLNSLDGYRFQIIFTTHSPIILSDLTEERIIRLKRDKNRIRVASQGEQTFGANIMKLYYDDFFMDNGSIGEFAKSKLNEVVNFLNGKDNSISLDEVNYIINHIGEPTVKKQLKQKLNKIELDEKQELMKLIEKLGVHHAIDCLKKGGKDDTNQM